MTTWTVSDIIDIIKEGVPFSDLNHISINADTGNYIMLKVSCNVSVPLEKIKDISINTNSVQMFFAQMLHPELTNNGHVLEFNTYAQLYINDGKVSLPVTLVLNLENISSTARKIRDSNFYSVLEAAIDN